MIQTGGSSKTTLLTCDDAWDQFLDDNYDEDIDIQENNVLEEQNIPKCSDIYISTKTKIAYLNKPVNLKETFWKIPIMDYYRPENGVIKKQIKYSFKDVDEVKNIDILLEKRKYSRTTTNSKNK